MTELKDINNQMDEIGLMSCMTNEDFMLYVMDNLPLKYEAVLTDLENRLITKNSDKLTNEVMHQK